MNISFENQTVIVTGAAHGFGRAICIAFAQRGAHVWGCDVLADELAHTQQLCAEAGGTCDVRTVDITNPDAVKSLVGETGQVHVLVNNAGGVLGQVGRPLEEVSPQDWNNIFAVNTSGAFYLSQAVAPR